MILYLDASFTLHSAKQFHVGFDQIPGKWSIRNSFSGFYIAPDIIRLYELSGRGRAQFEGPVQA